MALRRSSRSRGGLGFYCEVEERDDDEESECLEIRDGGWMDLIGCIYLKLQL